MFLCYTNTILNGVAVSFCSIFLNLILCIFYQVMWHHIYDNSNLLVWFLTQMKVTVTEVLIEVSQSLHAQNVGM